MLYLIFKKKIIPVSGKQLQKIQGQYSFSPKQTRKCSFTHLRTYYRFTYSRNYL